MQSQTMSEIIIGRVSPEMAAGIKRRATELEIPVSEVLRVAVIRYLSEPLEGLVRGKRFDA